MLWESLGEENSGSFWMPWVKAVSLTGPIGRAMPWAILFSIAQRGAEGPRRLLLAKGLARPGEDLVY